MSLTHLDLFTGCGGFSLAAARCGFTTVAQCEIDPFCRRVLTKHWPEVPNLGDITKIDPADVPDARLWTAGFPCQDASVAGKRAGLAGTRTSLFYEILRLIDGVAVRPDWLVLENVPGLASVNGGRDLGSIVSELRRRDFLGCVRLLDGRYDGVAQRRKRLFFVCGVGERGLRALHLILEGGERYPAPGYGPGENVAGSLGGGSGSRGWCSDTDRMTFLPVAGTLGASGAGTQQAAGNENELDFLVAGTLDTCTGGVDENDARDGRLVSVSAIAPPLTHNPWGDHESRDGLLVAYGGNRQSGPLDVATACNAKGGTMRSDFESETFVVQEVAPTLSHNRKGGLSGQDAKNGALVIQHPIAFNWQAGGNTGAALDTNGERTGCLQANQVPAVAFSLHGRVGGSQAEIAEDGLANALRTPGAGSSHQLVAQTFQERRLGVKAQVRRLTPT